MTTPTGPSPTDAPHESQPGEIAYFDRDPDDAGVLHPQPRARSLWGTGQIHGVAISGALARGAEAAVAHRPDLRPARLTVDLFRPAAMEPVEVRAEVVREGRRVALVDARMLQGGRPVARAGVVMLAAGVTPDLALWTPSREPLEPPDRVPAGSTTPHVPFFRSGDVPWSDDLSAAPDAGRKAVWHTALPVVAGEVPTPFQAVAAIADSASMVCNWGPGGVQHINSDISLSLARLPGGLQVGLLAVERLESDGIAVGTVRMYDRDGAIGVCTVTALANSSDPVSFSDRTFTEGSGA